MEVIASDDLKVLQEKTVQMAKYFVDFCEKYDLKCYLCGGGCIGTIRHRGYIPWDDDLDFFMPRDDYEKMRRLWVKKICDERYVLECSDSEHVDHNLFVTIRDPKTTYIKPYQKDIDITHGIVLDILPLDGYPKGKIKRKIQCMWALLYSLYRAQIIPTNHGKKIAFLSKIALGLVPSKRVRYCIWRLAEKHMTKYPISECDGITELCSGPGYMKNWYPKEAFSKAIFKEFGNTTMPIPVGYDAYLKIAFGDYMTMPPEERRIAQHEVLFMDLEKSYRDYKGIQYLKEVEL